MGCGSGVAAGRDSAGRAEKGCGREGFPLDSTHGGGESWEGGGVGMGAVSSRGEGSAAGAGARIGAGAGDGTGAGTGAGAGSGAGTGVSTSGGRGSGSGSGVGSASGDTGSVSGCGGPGLEEMGVSSGSGAGAGGGGTDGARSSGAGAGACAAGGTARGRCPKGLKGSSARAGFPEERVGLSVAVLAGGLPASRGPRASTGSGATMLREQAGQGPSKPAAARGTRRVLPHAGQWNWITSAIRMSFHAMDPAGCRCREAGPAAAQTVNSSIRTAPMSGSVASRAT